MDSGEKETDAILKTPSQKRKNSLHVLREAPDGLPVTHIDPRDLRGSLPDLAKRPPSSIAMASAEEVHEEYSAALAKLTANVRPLIMNLAELANEYKRPHARMIAKLIDERIRTVRREYKMPALYLLDSIIKNHGDPYRAVFQPYLVAAFAAVFEANEDPGVRTQLYKLRNTWPSLFDPRVLEALDVKVQREFDRKWPVQKVPQAAQPQPVVAPSTNIHINPAHIKNASFERELEAKRAELKRLQLQMEIDKAAEEIARKEALATASGSTTQGTKAVKSDAPTSKVKVNNSPSSLPSTVAPWPSLLNRRPPTPGSSKSVSLSHENVIFLSAASTAVTRTIRNAKSNGFRVSRDDLSSFLECEFLEYTEQATTTSSSASIESVFPSLLVLL